MDEFFSLYASRQSVHDIIFCYTSPENPNTIPPLYVLLSHFWIKWFGESAFAMRSLSPFFGILAIYMVYLLARKITDSRAGLLAALFATLSFNWFQLFRQNRCYSLFILLSLVSFYAFYSLLKEGNSERRAFKWQLLLTAANILAVYTHYFAFLIVGMQALFAFVEWEKYRPNVKGVFWMCVAVAVSYIPWYQNLFFDLEREPTIVNWSLQYRSTVPIRVALRFLNIIFSDFHFLWNPILVIVYLPFIFRGFIRLKKNLRGNLLHVPVYLLITLAIPLAVVFFYLKSGRTRYFAPFLFPMFIFLSYGLSDLFSKKNIFKIPVALLVSLIASNNILDFQEYYRYPMDEQWKKAARIIREAPNPAKNNAFVFQSTYNPPVFAYYYWGPEAAGLFIDRIATKKGYEDILEKIGAKERLFLVRETASRDFFARLDGLPGGMWIWVFRYGDPDFKRLLHMRNHGRYIVRQIKLNKAFPPVELFLLKKAKGRANETEPGT